MTADDARDRISEMREALRRASRAVSVPKPDWAGAARAMDGVNEQSCELWQACVRESWKAPFARAGRAVPDDERGEPR